LIGKANQWGGHNGAKDAEGDQNQSIVTGKKFGKGRTLEPKRKIIFLGEKDNQTAKIAHWSSDSGKKRIASLEKNLNGKRLAATLSVLSIVGERSEKKGEQRGERTASHKKRQRTA